MKTRIFCPDIPCVILFKISAKHYTAILSIVYDGYNIHSGGFTHFVTLDPVLLRASFRQINN